MEPQFWHQRWALNEIGFHEPIVNPMLANHLDHLHLSPGDRIFLPLCGKTLDIDWLLAQGMKVVGVELSEIAIKALFDHLQLTPVIVNLGVVQHYSAPNLDIFVGDIFAVSAAMLGPVHAVYDRAALVALPTPLRDQYAAHLPQLSGAVPVLQVIFSYDQTQMDGPPFSITEAELGRLYGHSYQLSMLETKAVPGGMRGKVPATESAWLLMHR